MFDAVHRAVWHDAQPMTFSSDDTVRMSNWTDDAWIYATAPMQVTCAKCDQSIPAGEKAAKVPGLNARGWAHLRCLPSRS